MKLKKRVQTTVMMKTILPVYGGFFSERASFDAVSTYIYKSKKKKNVGKRPIKRSTCQGCAILNEKPYYWKNGDFYTFAKTTSPG